MASRPRAALLLAAAAAVGCAGSEPRGPSTPRGFPDDDAPYELADDRDLEILQGRYHAMPLDSEARERARSRLASEQVRRIRSAAADGRRGSAYEAVTALLSLWHPREIADEGARAELASYRDALIRARALFARAGKDRQTAAILYALMEADPDRADDHREEIDEIFAFTDELAVVEYGDGAQRARPIEILEHAIEVFPSPAVLADLTDLYVERQSALGSQFRRRGAEVRVMRAHGDGVLNTTRAIIRAHAHALRVRDALEPIEAITDFGDDADLRRALARALGKREEGEDRAENARDGGDPGGDATGDDSRDDATGRPGGDATGDDNRGDGGAGAAGEREGGGAVADRVARRAQAWLELADGLLGEDGEEGDPRAARRVCEEALRALPDSADLHVCVADRAVDEENAALAAAHYERARELAPDESDLADRLSAIYEYQIGRLAFDRRPRAAADILDSLARLEAEAAERWPDHELPETRADGEAALGRGLVGMGALGAGRHYLRRAASAGHHIRALEHLGLIDKKQGRYERALAYLERAAAEEPDRPIDHFDRARVLRLAAQAAEDSGDAERAEEHASAALSAWERIGREFGPLRATYQGEMYAEIGALRWTRGDRDGAVEAFRNASSADPDGAATHARAVAFLLLRGERSAALDLYHRALGNREIDDYYKIYMSLWVAVDSAMREVPNDPVAESYLAGRSGRLWHDNLAAWASGRASLAALRAEADTPGRRAELYYYRAMLEEQSRDTARAEALLRRVLETDVILYFEYDMAQHWLEQGAAVAD